MIQVSKHANRRFRERICCSVDDVAAAIRASVEHGAIRMPARTPHGARKLAGEWFELRTREPFAMRLLMRDDVVITVKWPCGGDRESARGRWTQRNGRAHCQRQPS